MQIILSMVAATVIGAMIAMQPPLNAILSRGIGSAFGATAISIGIAFACILLTLVFTGTGDLSPTSLATVPWWVIFAGIFGRFLSTRAW